MSRSRRGWFVPKENTAADNDRGAAHRALLSGAKT
jgi:hypothetical protein